MVYSAIPLGTSLMCFRFLQVLVGFIKTGELPHHDHGHVDGLEDDATIASNAATASDQELACYVVIVKAQSLAIGRQHSRLHAAARDLKPYHLEHALLNIYYFIIDGVYFDRTSFN
jgi:hypothetical protein